MTKKLRDFYFKNPSVRAFLKGIDKRDEKYIINAMSNIEMESGEAVVKKGCYERCLILVAGGELVSFSDSENTVYSEGAILGVEQFLFNKPWPEELICKQQATLCKFTHDKMVDMVTSNALAASRLYKRIVRHFCFQQIYAKKQENMHLFKFKNVEDDMLFIDFKLDVKQPGQEEVMQLITQARPEENRHNRDKLLKEETTKIMPYFLTHQYQSVLEASQRQLEKLKEADKKANAGPAGLYKSSFLRDKFEAQN